MGKWGERKTDAQYSADYKQRQIEEHGEEAWKKKNRENYRKRRDKQKETAKERLGQAILENTVAERKDIMKLEAGNRKHNGEMVTGNRKHNGKMQLISLKAMLKAGAKSRKQVAKIASQATPPSAPRVAFKRAPSVTQEESVLEKESALEEESVPELGSVSTAGKANRQETSVVGYASSVAGLSPIPESVLLESSVAGSPPDDSSGVSTYHGNNSASHGDNSAWTRGKRIICPLTREYREESFNMDEDAVLAMNGAQLCQMAIEKNIPVQPQAGLGKVLEQVRGGLPEHIMGDLDYIANEYNRLKHKKWMVPLDNRRLYEDRLLRALRMLCPNWRLQHYNAGA